MAAEVKATVATNRQKWSRASPVSGDACGCARRRNPATLHTSSFAMGLRMSSGSTGDTSNGFRPDKMPRRLVYVVNRRTVVDQTTDEVEK